MRRVLLAIGTLLAVGGLGVGMAPAANAAPANLGGGCNRTVMNGFNFQSCISAQKTHVMPDMHVDAIPGGNCKFQWQLFMNFHVIKSNTIPCAKGHLLLPTNDGAGMYFLHVDATVNGQKRATADSPHILVF